MVDRQKLYEHILTTIEEMPNQMQKVFVLQRYYGLGRNDIVQKVGIEAKEVAFLLRAAEQLLYQTLKPLRTGEVELGGDEQRRSGVRPACNDMTSDVKSEKEDTGRIVGSTSDSAFIPRSSREIAVVGISCFEVCVQSTRAMAKKPHFSPLEWRPTWAGRVKVKMNC
ncbi:MAG TPA: hypothetical protein VKZ59_02640 [Acidobacteriota bacterium]|nr:hypothetical protein [Acidobacteriota bacterium]